MPQRAKEVYVVSDIHLGGHDAANPAQRGFRLFTRTECFASFIRQLGNNSRDSASLELVINGDFVDFLTEWDTSSAFQTKHWSPLKDAEAAQRVLEKITQDEQPIFEALADFLEKGNRLTLLLGNH